MANVGQKTITKKLLFILAFALILRLLLILIHIRTPMFSIQQDNYANYSDAILHGTIHTTFPKEDRRLFPGYVLIILPFSIIFRSSVLAGVAISIFSTIGALYLFYLLTKNIWATTIFSFFTPVWVVEGTKVATEPLMTFLLLLSLFSYFKKKYIWCGFILGFAFDVRVIAITLFLTFIYLQVTKRNWQALLKISFGFFIMMMCLFIYNATVFGNAHIFEQFAIYPTFGRATIGIVQLLEDIPRTIDWKQYRILISGLLYIFFTLLACYGLWRKRKQRENKTYFLWLLLSLFFIFLLGPTPILEEFGRFTVPLTPAIIMGLLSYL